MAQQQGPSPGAKLRELIHRKDRVLAVLHGVKVGLSKDGVFPARGHGSAR